MEDLAERFRTQGLHPAPLPVGLDYRPSGRCIRCGTCDAFPCRVMAKGDADVCAVRPALDSPNVEIWTESLVTRITTDLSGLRATGVEVDRGGDRVQVEADYVVAACGAVNSAALLLRSATNGHPHGLAN